MKYKSCKHIEGSLYIAPNEVRSCCQRFFYKNKMRGDAELIKINENDKLPGYDEIKNARLKLFENIQENKSEQCMGCPQLYETSVKPKFNGEINHLSVEHHSVCNLRCTYCSEIYYGGKRSKYDVTEFVKKLSSENSLKNCKQVVWGGGEPTLDKTFEEIVVGIQNSANPKIYHRVFTNSVRYHDAIFKFLKSGLIKIVTSIDSGTPETFKKVRGRDKFPDVFSNLKKYSSAGSNRITIKYIFTEENMNFAELDKFVENCVKYKLTECCYQISMNYKNDKLSLDFLKSVIYLMGLFKKNNINKFFGDDHIMSRFKTLEVNEKKDLDTFLKEHELQDIILNNILKNEKLNFFGINLIVENILNKTLNQTQLNQITLIDSDKNKQGKTLKGKQIMDPKILLNSSDKIFIAPPQSYDDIHDQLLNKLKIKKNRIIHGVFI